MPSIFETARWACHFRGKPALLGVVIAAVVGCGGPNKGNIDVRKQLQARDEQIATLKRQHDGDVATIKTLQGSATTVPSLPFERLESLFTVHGIRLGKVTGGADLDSSKPGDDGLKVYLIPTDETGDDIKATGTVVIEAFDLAAQDTRLGRWEFSSAQLKPMWNGHGMLYEFIIPCPWQTVPQHEKVTIKVSFTDALTGRTFDAQTIASVKLPHS